MTPNVDLVLMRTNGSGDYEEIKRISMERARNGGGISIERVQAQGLALNFSEFEDVNIQAVQADATCIKIFVTKRGDEESEG